MPQILLPTFRVVFLFLPFFFLFLLLFFSTLSTGTEAAEQLTRLFSLRYVSTSLVSGLAPAVPRPRPWPLVSGVSVSLCHTSPSTSRTLSSIRG